MIKKSKNSSKKSPGRLSRTMSARELRIYRSGEEAANNRHTSLENDLKGIRESSSVLAKGYMDLCTKLDAMHSEEKSLRMCIGDSIMLFLLQQLQLESAHNKDGVPNPAVEDSYKRLMEAIKDGCQSYRQQNAHVAFADRGVLSQLMGWDTEDIPK